MPAITYPASLPAPQSLQRVPAERRSMVGRPGPWQVRAGGRERLQEHQATWILTPAQAAVFRTWWTDDLVHGGAWFLMNRYPGAAVALRFAEPPTWDHAGVGLWRVSARMLQRGGATAPATDEAIARPVFGGLVDTFTAADATDPTSRDMDSGQRWTPVSGRAVGSIVGNAWRTATTRSTLRYDPPSDMVIYPASVATLVDCVVVRGNVDFEMNNAVETYLNVDASSVVTCQAFGSSGPAANQNPLIIETLSLSVGSRIRFAAYADGSVMRLLVNGSVIATQPMVGYPPLSWIRLDARNHTAARDVAEVGVYLGLTLSDVTALTVI